MKANLKMICGVAVALAWMGFRVVAGEIVGDGARLEAVRIVEARAEARLLTLLPDGPHRRGAPDREPA